MNLCITSSKNIELPPENSVNFFIDSETSTLRGKRSTGEILEFSKTIEVQPDYSNLGITISSSDVKSGKYFIDSTGTLVEGSLNESSITKSSNQITLTYGFINEAQTIQVGTLYSGSNELIPGTEDQIIVADTFLSNQVVIKGDANLLAENIKEGVTIFGVVGTYASSTNTNINIDPNLDLTKIKILVEGAGSSLYNGEYSYGNYYNGGDSEAENHCWIMNDPRDTTNSSSLYVYYFMNGDANKNWDWAGIPEGAKWAILSFQDSGMYYTIAENPEAGGWVCINGSSPVPTVTFINSGSGGNGQYGPDTDWSKYSLKIEGVTNITFDPNDINKTFSYNSNKGAMTADYTGTYYQWGDFSMMCQIVYLPNADGNTGVIATGEKWSISSFGNKMYYCLDDDPTIGTWWKVNSYGSDTEDTFTVSLIEN